MRDGAGFVVEMGDVEAMAEKIAVLMEDAELRGRLGGTAQERVRGYYTTGKVAPHVYAWARGAAGRMPAISVVVPNYNHAPYLRQRLDTIFAQTFRDFEVVLLDDCSTDGSFQILEEYSRYPEVRLVANTENSGSPFAQWLKGIDLCRSDLIWIAESDDYSDPEFLERLLPLLGDPDVAMAYCASRAVDSKGKFLGIYGNSEYLTRIHPTRWRSPFVVDGRDEVARHGLGVKNTMLNISSVVFRRFYLEEEVRDEIAKMRFAGDWLFLLAASREGKIAYVPDELNTHRRHESSQFGKILEGRDLESIRSLCRELETVYRFVSKRFELDEDYLRMWEMAILELGEALLGSSEAEDLEAYFPYSELKELLRSRVAVGAELRSTASGPRAGR